MLTGLSREFWEEGKSADCPVYDMHGHMGPFRGFYCPFYEPEEAVMRMKRAGVKMLAFSHHAALFSPDSRNKKSIEAARKFPGLLKAYCVINPNYPDDVARELESYDRFDDVYVGLKLHPPAHKTPLTDEKYRRALEFADSRELPVLSHTWGGDKFCGEDEVRKIAGKYKKAKLILGHSLHGAWQEAVAIAGTFPNAYLDLCAVSDERAGLLEKFVAGAGSEKILFGTDFPWFNHHYYIGAVIAADISDEDRRNIFYRNARKLIGQ